LAVMYWRNASGVRPETKEESLRAGLFALRLVTLGILVIYGIAALYFLFTGGP
jgi:hypothetical protein